MGEKYKITEEDLKNVEKGSLLEFERGEFSHWGVYIGNGEVCHFGHRGKTGGVSGIQTGEGEIRKDMFSDVAGKSVVWVNNLNDRKWPPKEPSEIVNRALKAMKESNPLTYDVVLFNCEHFANWCRYGKVESDQVQFVGGGILTAATFGALASILLGRPSPSSF